MLSGRWSLVDVPLICSCLADHVRDWQRRILSGTVEARSVDVKDTHRVLSIRYLLTVRVLKINPDDGC